MNCPNCGANYKKGDTFCGHCGGRLDGKEDTKVEDRDPVVVEKDSTFNSDEDLIDAFIGNNADKIKHNSFSVCTFLFRGVYFMYRKMYLYGSLWIVGVPLVMLFLPGIGFVIPFIAAIIISIKFRDIYLGYVKEKVGDIKRNNPNAKHEELVNLCRKKGGTNIVPVIIIGAVEALILFLLILFSYLLINVANGFLDGFFGTQEEDTSEIKYYTEDETVVNGKISYTVPAGFNDSAFGNTDTYSYYKHSSDNDFCSFAVSSYSTREETPKNLILSYIPSNHETIEEEITINGLSWYSVKDLDGYSKEYYYGTIKGGRFYKYNFTLYDQGDVCGTARETVLNSIVIGD